MHDRRAALVRSASLLCWIAYFAVPTDAGGLIDGIPLGPLETVALLALTWLAWKDEVPRGWVVAALVIVSAAGAALIPGASGFRARYFANATATGPHERSTEYRNQAFTRIDARLDFAPGGPEFPLAFVNDISRFNFYVPGQPRRRQLEFAVSWSGQWWTDASEATLYLEAPESTAQLFVDGTAVASTTPTAGAVEVTLPLTPGWHRIDASFSSPYGAPRRFSAGEVRGGVHQPFDATSVVTQRIRPWQLAAARALRWVKIVGDALALAWLAWRFIVSLARHLSELSGGWSWLAQRRRVIPLVAMAAAIEGLVFAWPWSQRLLVMAGGDDPMTYEWYSRDILFNGLLMNFGLPAGQGEPFYYQAFYPYFLAAVHAVFGEGMFGVMLVQRLLVAFTVWAIIEIAVAIGGEHRWPGALACGMVFAIWKQSRISADLLNESLYVPLLVAWVAVLLRMGRSPSTRGAFGAGVLGGVAAMTRSTVLLAWPAVWVVCWRSWRTAASWRIPLAVLALCSVLTFSLIGARNWIVSGRWVMTSSELGVTLLGGNEPPPDVVINPSERASLYQRLGFNDYTVQVIEYAITAPGTFARHQGRKALFALGFYEPYAPGWGYSPIYIAGWMLAVGGVLVAMRAARAPLSAILLPGVIAASQFMAVVMVYPKAERLILPIYALLTPYAGIAVAAAAGAARRRLGR